jgi:hypothetical protein
MRGQIPKRKTAEIAGSIRLVKVNGFTGATKSIENC